MLILAALLTGGLSFFISAIFNRLAYFLIVYFAAIIFNIELLSLFKAVNAQNIIWLTMVETVIALIVWLIKDKPLIKISFPFYELKKTFIEDKTFILLGAVWLIFIVTAFILAGFSPVTEPDAQSYHALRALFWLKAGYIHHFETADARNLCLAINSELFYFWIFSLFKKDTLFGLLQFFSYFQLIFCSFKIMEIFEIPFVKRVWAILIFSSFASVIIETSSTQTDLLTGALLVSSIYFILEYKKTQKFNLLFFAALSMGISFGVKTTAFMASIPILIWFIFILKNDFIKYFALLFLNSFVFSGYNYILNFITFGNFISGDAFYLYNAHYGGFKGFISNIIKYLTQFIDFSGLNLGMYLNKYILSARDTLLTALSIPLDLCEIDALSAVNIHMHEVSGAFGILGFLVFLPSLFAALFKKNLRIFSLLFFIPFLILCATMAYTIYGMRYILCFAAVSMPVLSLSYFKKMNILKFIFLIYAVFYMGYTSFYSPNRPLAYILRETPKGLIYIQDTLRNLGYRFFGDETSSEAHAFRAIAEPYCKEGNKIAIVTPGVNLIYSAKYLELNNDCRIDTPNLLHIKNYDMSRYKLIAAGNKNLGQISLVLNKDDIKNPVVNSNAVDCAYIISDKGKKPGLASAMQAECFIKKDFLRDLGFEKRKSQYFLKHLKTNPEIVEIGIWVK